MHRYSPVTTADNNTVGGKGVGTRAAVLRGELGSRSLALILFYLAASAAANAVPFRSNAEILGTAVSVRGVVFALLIVTAAAESQTAHGPPPPLDLATAPTN